MKRVLLYLLLIFGVSATFTESFAQVPGMPNRWNPVAMPDLDSGLVDAGSFTIGTKTYVVGGDTSGDYGVTSRPTKTMWIFDHTTRTWSRGVDFPGEPRVNPVAFGSTSQGVGYYGLGYDSKVYQDTMGNGFVIDTGATPDRPGYADSFYFERYHLYHDFYKYDPATQTWTRLKDFPMASLGAGVRKEWFFSGLPWDNQTQFVAQSNGFMGTASFALDQIVTINGSASRHFAGGFAFGQYIKDFRTATPYKYPGEVGTKETVLEWNNRVFFYHAAQDSFYFGPIYGGGLTPRSRGVATILDRDHNTAGVQPRLYLGLGTDFRTDPNLLNLHLKDWYSYSFTTNTWKRERDLIDTGKSSASAFPFYHYGFVVGGFDGDWSKKHFLYNTEDEDWLRYPDYRDPERSMGVAFVHDSIGYYGAGFRGNSDEHKTFSLFTIDTSVIRIEAQFNTNDEFCAGDTVTMKWKSSIAFGPTIQIQVQVSDEKGIFEWPMTPRSFMGTYVITGSRDTGTVKAALPHSLITGSQYRIRVISTVPRQIFSRLSPVIKVKENPQFTYYPKIHPFIDTICLNADYFVPVGVTGYVNPGNNLEYTWYKDGVPLSTQKKDTLYLTQTQFAQAGVYHLWAKGGCYAARSDSFYLAVSNIPPPTYVTNLTYPGLNNRTLTLCEFDTTTFSIQASAKSPNYFWMKDGVDITDGTYITGLGGSAIYHRGWRLVDSGVYRVRVQEDCGAYTLSDSIIIKVRELPRVVMDPLNIGDSTIIEGSTIHFKIRATGDGLSYRWRKEDTLLFDNGRIFGADTDSLTITNIIASDMSFYSCIVYGACPNSADTSNLAMVDINVAPEIIRQPNDSLTICDGTDNIISLIAKGVNMQYEWRYANPAGPLDPAHFSGINSRILNITDAQASHSGLIHCYIHNGKGAFVYSDTIVLTVLPTPAKPVITRTGSTLQVDLNCQTYIWFMNGVWKGQYSTRSIVPFEEGDYTVRVLCSGCPSETSDPVYSLSSIGENIFNQLEMYPNPANQMVVVELPGVTPEAPATVSIYDMNGKLVKSIKEVERETLEVNLIGLNPGVYLIKATSNEINFSGKLIKE